MNGSPVSQNMERHAQTAFTMLTVALLVWVGYSINQNQILIAKLLAKVDYLQDQIYELKYNEQPPR